MLLARGLFCFLRNVIVEDLRNACKDARCVERLFMFRFLMVLRVGRRALFFQRNGRNFLRDRLYFVAKRMEVAFGLLGYVYLKVVRECYKDDPLFIRGDRTFVRNCTVRPNERFDLYPGVVCVDPYLGRDVLGWVVNVFVERSRAAGLPVRLLTVLNGGRLGSPLLYTFFL